jgi:hypothetical protein
MDAGWAPQGQGGGVEELKRGVVGSGQYPPPPPKPEKTQGGGRGISRTRGCLAPVRRPGRLPPQPKPRRVSDWRTRHAWRKAPLAESGFRLLPRAIRPILCGLMIRCPMPPCRWPRGCRLDSVPPTPDIARDRLPYHLIPSLSSCQPPPCTTRKLEAGGEAQL